MVRKGFLMPVPRQSKVKLASFLFCGQYIGGAFFNLGVCDFRCGASIVNRASIKPFKSSQVLLSYSGYNQ